MVKMQLTTGAPCRPNTAYTIGGVSWAAKRRIQRKALHRCRDMKKTGVDSQHTEDNNMNKCQYKVCPMDICQDGKGRRPIGDNCCACPIILESPVVYNCLTRDTRELWTEEKTKWCCKNKGLGCPSQ